jgi:hypothetical protein
MAQANPNHTSHRSSDRIYPSLMGYTSRRPAGFPSIDRAALMRDAHRIASGARPHFSRYREAFAYGLRAAWMSAKSRQEIRSLAIQAGTPAVPFTAAQVKASRIATRRTGASLWAA